MFEKFVYSFYLPESNYCMDKFYPIVYRYTDEQFISMILPRYYFQSLPILVCLFKEQNSLYLFWGETLLYFDLYDCPNQSNRPI